MTDWIAGAAADPAALVTVLATEGSAPRGAGTRMAVTRAASVGTIGGGALEWRVAEQARAILDHPPGAWRVQDYPLGPLLGQCCGGRVRLLIEHVAGRDWMASVDAGRTVTAMLESDGIRRRIDDGAPVGAIAARGPLPVAGDRFVEPLDTPRRPLLLFGAGHVGRAIAHALPGLPFDLAWFDSRTAADLPGVSIQSEPTLADCARAAPAGSAVVILTHDHGLDYRLTAAALRSDAAFVGLIGSATKRARFVTRLGAEGIDPDRLTCPIGIDGVDGKEPAVIAIALLAQLLRMPIAAKDA